MPTTPNYAWPYPVVGADLDTWGNILNATGNLIDAEMFKKANSANPVFTGVVTAPEFRGNPSVILRPTVDGPGAVQLQNAASVAIVSIDTTTQTVFTRSTLLVGKTTDDLVNRLQVEGKTAVVDASTDNTPAINIVKPNGGQARVNLSALAGNAVVIDFLEGSQKWIAGTGMVTTSPPSWDVQDFTGIHFPISCTASSSGIKQVTLKDRVLIGADTGLFGALSVSGSQTVVDSGAAIACVARFSGGGSYHNAIILDTTGAANASGYRRGMYWGSGYDDFSLARFPNSGAGPAIHDLFVSPLGRVAIGTTTPAFHLEVYGAGFAQPDYFSPSNNIGNSVAIFESAASGHTGGACVFGVVNLALAAIKTGLITGAGYGQGYLSFYTRSATGNEHLTEAVQITTNQQMKMTYLQAANPGAGSKQFWYDPADGNTVKFAA
jgi:hypothetical protein